MIFYLSGTGNTKWVAESIAQATGDRLVNVAEVVDEEPVCNPVHGENIGFCFPIHGWRPPKLMRMFISKINFSPAGDNYAFAVCTAGDTVGDAITLLHKDLARRGIRLTGCFDVKMPNTYVGLPFMDVDKKDVETQKLYAAHNRLKEIIGRIEAKEAAEDMKYIGRWPKINSYLLGHVFAKKIVSDSKFRVDKSICARCGKCIRFCPVGNIAEGEGAFPKWKHNGQCMTCFSCYHHCNRHAIQFGGITKSKGQYFCNLTEV